MVCSNFVDIYTPNVQILLKMPIYKNIIIPFLLSFLLVFISIILNVSLRIMGFDFGENLISYINQDMVNLLGKIYGKIVLIEFIFFASILQVTDLILKNRNTNKIYFILISIFLIFPFISAIGMYPQLYGDFFYLQYPSLIFILDIITEYTNPYIFEYSIYIGYFITLVYIIFKVFREKYLNYLVTTCYLLIFTIFHLRGEWIGLLIIYFVWKISLYKNIQINSIYSFLILVLLFLFYSFWIYQENFFFRTVTESSKPSIFIVSADSLRKDKIGSHRYGESITPNIDKFSNDAIKFSDHNTTIPRTFPSWTDLLTGKYSMEHKIRDMFPSPEEVEKIGTGEFPTLGHILSENGYETSVFSNFAGDIFPRADFGFQIIKTPDFNANIILYQKSLETQIFFLPILAGILSGGEYFQEINSFSNLGDGKFILRNWKSYLKDNSQKDIFSTLFFSVIHFPYSPPYPYYNKFSKPSYKGKYKFLKFVDPTDDRKPSEEDIEQIRALYDESVLAFDQSFGEFVEYLKKIDKYENSIIILTGDHGEALYEDIHGHGHGEHLRGEAVLGVPLLIKFPKKFHDNLKISCNSSFCSEFKGITSNVDIFPTILDYLNVNLPAEYPGRSLMPVIGKENWEGERFIYAETGIWFSDTGDHFFQKQRIFYPNILKLHRIVPERNNQIMITDPFYRNTIAFAKHRAILSSKYKFIYIPTHDGVLYEFYDRELDPYNQKNLFPNSAMEPYRKELYSLTDKWENGKVIAEYIFPPPLD